MRSQGGRRTTGRESGVGARGPRAPGAAVGQPGKAFTRACRMCVRSMNGTVSARRTAERRRVEGAGGGRGQLGDCREEWWAVSPTPRTVSPVRL